MASPAPPLMHGLQVGRYRFRPGLWPTVAFLLLLPVLLGLGFWQLDRADQRQAAVDALAEGERAPVVQLDREQPAYDTVRHHRGQATGEPVVDRVFLVDNQVHQGRHGYRVLQPFRLSGSETVLLVDRGWVEAAEARSELPAPEWPSWGVLVEGVIDSGPSVGLRLGEPAEEHARWPRRLQYLDYDYVAGELDRPVVPYLLRLSPEHPAALIQDWSPTVLPPERHRGYALQWFGLGLALVVIWLVVNLKRERDDRA
ncbi:SURF1 family protein [Alkalilimnicola ehrlichii MLHE-1]|uniref:SURF1-like protein n=1 Tax=Alkalilimnicola ehrlichii (strain ATCC BAA-1101 / DSM 17681 / MLHE-1) TaxID=187272 RepID=Q0ABY4_ALKEH|nr:SURF1 family protein [Alkalilimnicola ehrlichii]ABI55653.1 conserved hypothetical protein [Alkalilimnicola ehrlichii MLHE-1]